MASVLPGTLYPGRMFVGKDYPAGAPPPPEYPQLGEKATEPEGTITMISTNTDPSWMRAPRDLTPKVRKGQRLNVISTGITPEACPAGPGLRYWQLEHGILVVDLLGKKGFAWFKS